MESLGGKLRNLREEKGYTLEQVARDTHIAKRYITAIEEEQFDDFPAEPYLLGFLRSYCEFLDINAEEIVQLYRNMKLQEQPPPIEQLVAQKRGPSIGLILGIIAGVAVLAGIVFLVVQLFFSADAEGAEETAAVASGTEYEFGEEILEQRFRVGDTVVVPLNGGRFPIQITAVGEEVVLATDESETVVRQEREHALDVSNDGQADVSVLLRAVDGAGESAEAVLRFDRLVASPARFADIPEDDRADETLPEVIGHTTIAERELAPVEIGTYPSPDPYDFSVRFTAPTLFRYRDEEAGESTEQFYNAGDTVSNRFAGRLRLWSSNAGATRLTVAGNEIELGQPGEVTAGAIRYVDTDDGRHRLELLPVY